MSIEFVSPKASENRARKISPAPFLHVQFRSKRHTVDHATKTRTQALAAECLHARKLAKHVVLVAAPDGKWVM
jgi:hypothetical protein